MKGSFWPSGSRWAWGDICNIMGQNYLMQPSTDPSIRTPGYLSLVICLLDLSLWSMASQLRFLRSFTLLHCISDSTFSKCNYVFLLLHEPWLHRHFLNSPVKGKGRSFGLNKWWKQEGTYIPAEKYYSFANISCFLSCTTE